MNNCCGNCFYSIRLRHLNVRSSSQNSEISLVKVNFCPSIMSLDLIDFWKMLETSLQGISFLSCCDLFDPLCMSIPENWRNQSVSLLSIQMWLNQIFKQKILTYLNFYLKYIETSKIITQFVEFILVFYT